MMLNFLFCFFFTFFSFLGAMKSNDRSLIANDDKLMLAIPDDAWSLILNYAVEANIMDLQKEFF